MDDADPTMKPTEGTAAGAWPEPAAHAAGESDARADRAVTTPEPIARSASARDEIALLSVVVPALNEAATIKVLLDRILEILASLGPGQARPPAVNANAPDASAARRAGVRISQFEIIVVDDGSTDGTREQLRRLNAREPRIKMLSLSRNFGKEVAVAAGLRYARGDAVLLMDADLQHPPDLIPDMLARWRDGYDVIYGARIDRRNEGPVKRVVAKTFYRLFRMLSGTKIPPDAGDYRLLSRQAVDALNRLGERARFNKGLFTWIGFRSVGVPFEVPVRAGGEPSRWPVRRLVRFALDGIASFTTIPLRIWSIVGLAVSLFAFGYAVVFLIKTLILGTDLAGFPTLIISIMMFTGIQLISLGILGEYIGRIYEEVKARPLYIVAEELGFEPVCASSARQSSTAAPHPETGKQT